MDRIKRLEARLLEVEDRLAIYQLVCGYGYAVDGCNGEVVGDLYAAEGTYAVADYATMSGRDAIVAITRDQDHRDLVARGCAHMSSLPYLVISGDRAVGTCYTMVPMNGPDGFYIGRLSASRLEFSRKPDGGWQIDHRQNYMLDGNEEGPAMLGRLREGPVAA